MIQSSFRRGEFYESVNKLRLDSDERTRDVLRQANNCKELGRRSRNLLSDSRHSLTEHGPYRHLAPAQVLELYDNATRRFLRTRDAEARREVIELHDLLQILKEPSPLLPAHR